MRKWAIAGMIYVTVVIIGFQAYNKWIAGDKSAAATVQNMGKTDNHKAGKVTENNMEEMNGEDGGGHDHAMSHNEESQVNAFVFNDKNMIKIYLKDKAGNPVDKLELNHEKKLHLIIVDEQLQKYYHLHPKRIGKGVYSISNPLADGYYKAFIDIKPKSYAYQVEPVPFIVGNPSASTQSHSLQPDTSLKKMVDAEQVSLKVSSFKAGENVKLTFDLDKTKLTPHLGAIGHVVILDEYGKKYLHVHPSNNSEAIFETMFEKPGIYKIWAEFKQNGKVRAFPFVIKVKD